MAPFAEQLLLVGQSSGRFPRGTGCTNLHATFGSEPETTDTRTSHSPEFRQRSPTFTRVPVVKVPWDVGGLY